MMQYDKESVLPQLPEDMVHLLLTYAHPVVLCCRRCGEVLLSEEFVPLARSGHRIRCRMVGDALWLWDMDAPPRLLGSADPVTSSPRPQSRLWDEVRLDDETSTTPPLDRTPRYLVHRRRRFSNVRATLIGVRPYTRLGGVPLCLQCISRCRRAWTAWTG